MSPKARYAATALGLAGLAVCVFFLFHSVPIVVDWVAWLFGNTPAKPHLEGLAMFVGIASTLGTIVLLVAIGLILWVFKRMWLPGPERRQD
jgi:hypothetical protein